MRNLINPLGVSIDQEDSKASYLSDYKEIQVVTRTFTILLVDKDWTEP